MESPALGSWESPPASGCFVQEAPDTLTLCRERRMCQRDERKSHSSHFLQVQLLFGFSTSLCWPEPSPAVQSCQGQQRSWVCAHTALREREERGSTSDSCRPQHLSLRHKDSVPEVAEGCRHLAGMGITPRMWNRN